MSSTQERYGEYRDDQREFFDTLITDDWHTYPSAAWDARRRREVELLFRHVSPRTVLDVGCGSGFHDPEIAARPGVAEVVGIDYSERSIEVANREYPHPHVTRRVDDITAMPPGDFDLAVSFQVIEHLRDAVGFLAACRRQVRSGGWVAVVTPNGRRLNNRARRLYGKEPEILDPQHFHEWSPRELIAAAAELPLEPLSTAGFGLTLIAPKLARQVVPRALGERLGPRVPAVADGFLQVWRATP